MGDISSRDLVNLVITFFIPPLGVALKKGLGGCFLLNLALTVFGLYFAGLVHGIYVVLKD